MLSLNSFAKSFDKWESNLLRTFEWLMRIQPKKILLSRTLAIVLLPISVDCAISGTKSLKDHASRVASPVQKSLDITVCHQKGFNQISNFVLHSAFLATSNRLTFCQYVGLSGPENLQNYLIRISILGLLCCLALRDFLMRETIFSLRTNLQGLRRGKTIVLFLQNLGFIKICIAKKCGQGILNLLLSQFWMIALKFNISAQWYPQEPSSV